MNKEELKSLRAERNALRKEFKERKDDSSFLAEERIEKKKRLKKLEDTIRGCTTKGQKEKALEMREKLRESQGISRENEGVLKKNKEKIKEEQRDIKGNGQEIIRGFIKEAAKRSQGITKKKQEKTKGVQAVSKERVVSKEKTKEVQEISKEKQEKTKGGHWGILLFGLVAIFGVVIYLRYGEKIITRIKGLFPKKQEPEVSESQKEYDGRDWLPGD